MAEGRLQKEQRAVWRTAKLLLVAGAVAWALAACSVNKGLVRMDQPNPSLLADMGSQEALDEAVSQSIKYYRTLPETSRFEYGGLSYSPSEMARSMELFLKLHKESPNAEVFQRAVTRRFHVFESVNPKGENLFTGYYLPEIKGSLKPTQDMNAPVYSRPENLVVLNLESFGIKNPTRSQLVGRVENGTVHPYYTRREIQGKGVLEDKAKPLAYVNEIDLFFLQIQGSGLIRMEDGSRFMAGYDQTNGHPYRSVGALLANREVMMKEEVTMQSIRRYLQENPAKVRSILYSNPSYIFFKRAEGEPLGNIQVPLTPRRSLAMDHRLFPKGGLAFLSTQAPVMGDSSKTEPFSRFMLVQDTGGAIRGHGRADVYWGEGEEAEWIAGHMKHEGRIFLLVAKKEYLSPNVASGGQPDEPSASLAAPY